MSAMVWCLAVVAILIALIAASATYRLIRHAPRVDDDPASVPATPQP